jgi:Cytochrome c oxidase subunit IV
MSEIEQSGVPPAGEQIHMPAPSVLPLINAAGLAMAIVSLTFSWWLVGLGLVIFLSTAVLWIRSTRREIAELPLDHESH